MTTERDIRNQIRYAEKKGMEKEAEQIARRMLEMSLSKDVIQQATGLTEEQIKAQKHKKGPRSVPWSFFVTTPPSPPGAAGLRDDS